MRTRTWYALPFAGLLAVGGACAGLGQRSETTSDPSAQRVQTSQGQSQKALDDANKAQKRATEQAERAADAQKEVREAQQRLAQAQEKARQEQAKAQEMQTAANEATRRATQEAGQAQQQASEALSQQGQLVQSGQQTLSGLVRQAAADQVVVAPQGADPMTFKVTEQTQVQIDGRKASASEIRPGENALVAYQVSGTQPTAVSIKVVTTNPAVPAQPQSGATGSGQAGAATGSGAPASGTTSGSSDPASSTGSSAPAPSPGASPPSSAPGSAPPPSGSR